MAPSSAPSRSRKGGDVAFSVQDDQIEEAQIVGILKKHSKYGTIDQKKAALDLIVAKKNDILQIVPDALNDQLQQAFQLIDKLKTRPTNDEVSLVFYRTGAAIRAWRDQLKTTRGFPSNLVLSDGSDARELKAKINHLADKIIESLEECTKEKEGELLSNVIADLPASEVQRKYKQDAIVTIDDEELLQCLFCGHQYVDEPATNNENVKFNTQCYEEWQSICEQVEMQLKQPGTKQAGKFSANGEAV